MVHATSPYRSYSKVFQYWMRDKTTSSCHHVKQLFYIKGDLLYKCIIDLVLASADIVVLITDSSAVQKLIQVASNMKRIQFKSITAL